MKSIFIALFVVCSCFANAQVVPDFNKKSIQMNEKPVTNREYGSFLQFIKSDKSFSNEYVKSMFPDGWSLKKVNSENQNRAVEGVSWKQAMEYCKWKSEVVTYLRTHNKMASFSQMKTDNQLAKTVVICRLPTEAEYVKLSTKTVSGGAGFRCIYDIRKNA